MRWAGLTFRDLVLLGGFRNAIKDDLGDALPGLPQVAAPRHKNTQAAALFQCNMHQKCDGSSSATCPLDACLAVNSGKTSSISGKGAEVVGRKRWVGADDSLACR